MASSLEETNKEIRRKDVDVEQIKKERKGIHEAGKAAAGKTSVVDADILDNPRVPKKAKDEIKERILWQPLINPTTGRSVQREFLESTEDEVLFAGGRGSGKSDALLIEPLRFVEKHRDFWALIIRPSLKELEELMSRGKRLYADAFPGVKWSASTKTFIFPSGAKVEFGYCEHKDDVERYRGRQFSMLLIDELTMIPTEEMYNALRSSVRTTNSEIPPRTLCTTNPYGVGFIWVKNRFINQGPEGETITVKTDVPGYGTFTTTRKWLQSTIQDNPLVTADYVAYLATLPEEMRKRWLEGSWDGGSGLAFPEFDTAKHVIKPFDIPPTWPRFRACDWGYSTMAITVWFAVDPEERLYVYREHVASLTTADVFARDILSLEAGERIEYGVIDGSVGDKRGSSAPSVDEEMRNAGLIWRYGDKTAGSRLAGKNLMHKRLQVDRYLDTPTIFFFDTCRECIEEMGSLPSCPNNPEDVDTKAKDHAWDALRFGVLSRPRFTDEEWRTPIVAPPPVVDSWFGY